MRSASMGILLLASGLALATSGGLRAEAVPPSACVPVGTWVYPASGEKPDDALAALAKRDVVLLGESHDDAEHHRWQLHTIAGLFGYRRDMVLGFEMFPRRVQPVLDRWVKGELSEAEFLREVGWLEIWGFDAELYLPLFQFARMHRLPMLALNVDRATSRRIRGAGVAAIPPTEREGVGDPAPATPAYRDRLFEIFKGHATGREGVGADSEQFQHFVAAQLFWDRAMAEAIAGTRRGARPPLVVGIMGQGHVEYRDGVAHQLAALGVDNVATALPWNVDADCQSPEPGIADAVFGVASPKQTRVPPPRLGVVLTVTEGGVRIDRVIPNSVAEATGLQVGDVIENAAGVSIRRPDDLITVVRRQAPGTWLPLFVRRDGQGSEMVARFPAER